MRYSFLDLLACPLTGLPLRLDFQKEIAAPIPQPYCPEPRTGDAEKNRAVDVVTGLLVTEEDRWYPVINGIPEILPDRLRD